MIEGCAEHVRRYAEQVLGEEWQKVIAVTGEVGAEPVNVSQPASHQVERLRVDEVTGQVGEASLEPGQRVVDDRERGVLEGASVPDAGDERAVRWDADDPARLRPCRRDIRSGRRDTR